MSVVCYISLPLMNSFNKTKAAVFPMQAMLPGVLSLLPRLMTLPVFPAGQWRVPDGIPAQAGGDHRGRSQV